MSTVKVYHGNGVTVRFDAARCIHAAECVHGLPEVFDPQARPWVQPARAEAGAVAAVVARCPTGALTASHDDGRPAEPAPDANRAQLVADGPLHLRGTLTVRQADGTVLAQETRLALCRCGASKNKPFCDNSHVAAGFQHDGSGPASAPEPLAAGPLSLTLRPDGPVQCDGPLSVVDAFGDTLAAGTQTWLCRCGQSNNKPFCDGSHRAAGFKA